MKLTASQQKVYDCIFEYAQQGRVPTVREICLATGLKSTSTVHLHLKTLEQKGLITRDAGLNRSIQITGLNPACSIPLLGRVTAGIPILAIEEIECYIPVDENLKRGRELFALRVMGESMINAGIYDGDIIVVNKTPTAENGEIVVAMIDDEATVKRFYKENGHFRLQPENPAFEPIITDKAEILGKVISLIRNYE